MGGYDFPGSNSGVDMHALTGWIPERLPTADISPDADWDRMMRSLQSGNLLITVATGPLSPAEEERTGLSDCHACVKSKCHLLATVHLTFGDILLSLCELLSSSRFFFWEIGFDQKSFNRLQLLDSYSSWAHRYAVLDMREVEGYRMVHIKNPWQRKRWKGKFNPHDTTNWTPSIAAALQYVKKKPPSLEQVDFGVVHINVTFSV
jgi:hypothetical protein